MADNTIGGRVGEGKLQKTIYVPGKILNFIVSG
jgi:hypothetical protein